MRHNKRLGQHFLKIDSVLQKILDLIIAEKPDSILEIGAGSGALTAKLLQVKIPVIAVEVDTRWAKVLQERFAYSKYFTLINDDILKLDWKKLPLGGKCAFVGNLPYQISTPIFFSLIRNKELYDFFLVMFQKEFAERIIGDKRISKKFFSSLSVLAKLFFSLETVLPISKNDFYPVPKVDSCLIKMKKTNFDLQDLDSFLSFLRVVFRHPRKTLWNNLKNDCTLDLKSLSSLEQDKFKKIRIADLAEHDIFKIYCRINGKTRATL